MDRIVVDKAQLIETLTTNRDEHRAIFLKAQERYREKMIEELDRALLDAREGRAIKRAFALPVPEDHTDDFNTALEMLNWDQGDSVELGQHEFRQYVQNRWQWEASFTTNSLSYVSRPGS